MRSFLSIVLISCLGILAYSNTFHCSFHFDDFSSITDNFLIRNVSNLQDIWNILPRRFILYLSIALNYHFNGFDVFGYHVVNLAVHLISAILVWWLTLLTFSTPAMRIETIAKGPAGKKSARKTMSTVNPHAGLIALLAGLVFVSHPVQTQAVTYIVQRAASMATMFYLASLCFYVKSRLLQDSVIVKTTSSGVIARSEATKQSFKTFFYTCSLITAIAAMFTKETAITLPLTVLLYEFSFFRSASLPLRGEGKGGGKTWKFLVPFLLTIFIIPLTIHFTESIEAQQMRGALADGAPGISSMHYLLTEFRVMVTYIRLVFLPLNQNLDYDYPVSHSLFELPTLFSFLFLILVFLSTLRLFSKYRLVAFSILWFFLTLLPESSLFPIRDVIFEHRLYLPLVGYSMFLVSGVYYLLEKKSIKAMIIILAMMITCNTFLTYERNKIWKDDFTLWGDTVQKSPRKARPYSQLGIAYSKEGNLGQALSNYNKAIEIDPTDNQTYNDRGNIYALQGQFTKALADFDKAIGIHPNFAVPYYDRGLIFNIQGDFKKSVAEYSKAIENNPNYAGAFNNRAVAYYQLKEYDHAWDDLHKAQGLGYAVNPGFINALRQASGRDN